VALTVPPAWETSAKGEDGSTCPGELSTLGEHRAQCSARSGRWAALCNGVGQALGFVSARRVTMAALVFAVAVLWWIWG